MADSALNFTEFESYELTGVEISENELGHGAYATVLEVEYMGLKCAGKEIHEVLQKPGDAAYALCRFEEECRLLSKLRHPNIVQFLGIYFQQGKQVPILVMEFLPTNLTSCIEKYGILPNEISYSILYDVALGLCYLHNQTPAIIHRDLSANNVLLTSNMTAKISDLGVARILNLTPLQRLTQNPGTAAYMPPEVMVADPKYDTSIDVFSYGVLMIHVLSGRWPEPQEGPVRNLGSGKIIAICEAERREVFLQAIGKDHPLMDLIKGCIKNDPHFRPDIWKIVRRARMMISSDFPDIVEVLRLRRFQVQEGNAKQKVENDQERDVGLSGEVERLSLVQSNEVEQMRFQVSDLITQNRLLTLKTGAELTEMKVKTESLEQEKSELQKQIEEDNASRERLEGELAHSKTSIRTLQCTNLELEAKILRNDAAIVRKEVELEASEKALKAKDSIISGMKEQLSKTRDYLAMKQQVIQASITWKSCADLPTESSEAKTTVINGKLYCGGGVTKAFNDDFKVYCYDASQNAWSVLPQLPVRFFGIGRLNGTLVAVGGTKMGIKAMIQDISNKVYTYNEQLQEWEQTIPPMLTPRQSPGVLSLESDSALIVASGFTTGLEFANSVEIYQQKTSQWYRADPLPIQCCDLSMVAINNHCYALGGFQEPLCLNQAVCATLDDLLRNAIPADLIAHGGDNTPTAWKLLPDTAVYRPAAAMMAGYLLAIGGCETSQGGGDREEIYAYSPSTNSWIYIDNLPIPLREISINSLSPVEILVIGGQRGDSRMSTVYKGTLNLKF